MKVWSREDGALMVVGFAPDTLVKYYFSMETPSLMMFLVGAMVVFVFNLLLMIFLMLRNTRRVEKAMSPILRGIQDLSRGDYRPLDERGELAEINAGLNRARDYLMQKDNTRAAGDPACPTTSARHSLWCWVMPASWKTTLPFQRETRQQAGIIRRQGERLKSLVEDLNLTTKLEYALQPVRRETVDLVEIGRQAVSEVLNGGLPERYELDFSEDRPGCTARMEGDAALLRQMLDNLIRNSIAHNPQGCHISVTVGGRGWAMHLRSDG